MSVHQFAVVVLAMSVFATSAWAEDRLAVEDGQSDEVVTQPRGLLPSAPVSASIAIHHADELGPTYAVESVRWSVGGGVIGAEDTFEERPALRRVLREVARAEIAPGSRAMLRIDANLRGRGTGQFAFLNDYSVTVSATCPVALNASSTTHVEVVLVREGGLFADFGEGIGVRCRVTSGR